MQDKLGRKVVRKFVYSSRIQTDQIFFNENIGAYFSTGSIGADIWEAIEVPRSAIEISAELLKRYKVDHATCLTEVEAFLDELIASGLAERR